MRIAIPIVFSCTFFVFTAAQAQLGKLIKDKVKSSMPELAKKTKGFLADKVEESRSKFDSTSFNYAISLNDNSGLFDHKEKGEQFLVVMSNINPGDEPKTEAERARTNLDAGEVLYASGNYELAENRFLHAKLLYETQDLKDDPNYVKLISNLGLLYSTMGRFDTSKDYIEQSMQIRQEKYGEQSSGYGASLNNYAVLLKETGQYNLSGEQIMQALEVIRQANGENSMPYAIALNNQAMLYQTMGRYGQAETLMAEVLGVSGNLQNEKSANHQKFLANRALLFQEMGEYDKAEAEFKELVRLKKRRFGSGHPDYAHVLNNLAALYVEMGQYDEVEPLLNEAIAIYKKKFGEDHPVYAAAISDLGNFYRFKERWDEAEPLLIKSHATKKKTLGENHPSYAQSQEDLAILYWNTGDLAQAERLYKQSVDKSIDFIQEFFPPMSEAEKTRYWDKLRPRFERFFSFAVEARAEYPELMSQVYEYHIATKGLLLSATGKIKSKILSSGDEDLVRDYLGWLDQKEMLARFYSYSKEELRERNIDLDSIEQEVNATERSLSGRSDLFSEGYDAEMPGFDNIQARLSPGEAIVDLVRFRKFDHRFTTEVKYVALIIKPGTDKPGYVVLDDGAELEGRYYKYYNNSIQQQAKDEYSYKKYWLEIDAKLAGVKKLYLSADGIYNQLNINTLQMPSGEYVLQNYETVLVSNSKNVKPGVNKKGERTAVLIGNPPFQGAISPLPGTKLELDYVARRLSSAGFLPLRYTGSEATESNMKSVQSPMVLHVATHGYFLKDESINTNRVFGVSAESARGNPLLRSGILLKDAEKTINNNYSSLESNDNGILTAFEAMNLDLESTELVILSACETGTGDIKAGEGVYGLQRAFLVAGAQALVMSLWKVDDKATQELMSNFYKYWTQHNNRAKAFRQAQADLKRKYASPYYWGAFIMVEN